ncbi:MAG: EAL domain-containing protein [Hydrogenothermaceae bacterium]
MLKFLSCAHISESKRDKDIITALKLKLESVLEQKIELIIPNSYKEEQIYLEDPNIDLIFVDPLTAYRKIEEGYKLFKIKDIKKEKFLLVGRQKERDNVLITASLFEAYFVSLLLFKEFDLLKEIISYTDSQRESYLKVIKGEADITVLYRESFNTLSKEFGELPILKEIESPFYHYLVISKNLYEKFKDRLDKVDNIKPISDEEIDRLYEFTVHLSETFKVKQFFDIAKFTIENPHTGLILYRDKIVYATKSATDILGFSFEEFLNMSLLDIIADEDLKDEIEDIVERRLKGELFDKIYPAVKVKTKDGNIKYVRVFSRTVLFESKYHGIILFQDITKEVLYQKLYKALRDINRSITTVLIEEDLFQNVCQSLIQNLDVKYAWIGVINDKTRTYSKIYSCGEGEGYLDKIEVFEGGKLPLLNSSTKSYVEGKIITNLSTEGMPLSDSRTYMLERGFLSSTAIPIMKKDKVYAVLNIYSTIPYFFEEKTILEEIKHDMSFALNKIDTKRKSILLEKAFSKSSEWLLITDEYGNIEYVNDYIVSLTGYTWEELVGKNPRIFKSGYHQPEFYKKLWDTIKSGKEFEAIFVNRKKNGEMFYIEEKIIPVKFEGNVVKYVSIGRDLTLEKRLLEENEKLRYFDILTGLYNLSGFAAQVENYLSVNYDEISSLILLDIANFSYINKTYGVEIGDEVLRSIGESLRNHFKRDDIIGRVGGDEFAIFSKNLKSRESLFLLIERVKDILDRDNVFTISGENINLSINGAIVVFPDDGRTFKELIQNASITLKVAKEEGENVIKLFNKNIEEKIKSLFHVENLLVKAVKERLFIFHYQPYFDMNSGKIAGFEALVRIKDRDGNIYYPKDFIDQLERSYYLSDFTDWAIKEITSKINVWKKSIGINISARTFKDPKFVEKIRENAKNLDMPLIVEITERLYMEDPQHSHEVIKELKECKNVKIAIDDFGTGYSSLSYLKDIQADILKIDISFVRAMVDDEKSRIIVNTIINLAKELGMKTLAEGVETQIQYNMLKEMNVDYVQGFLLSKPLPEEFVEKIVNL